MSTVKANDLQNTSGGIPTVKGQNLIPTAWVNFNGTGTVAIRDSENVSSITDNAAGDYTLNFATAMSNANYAIAGASLNGGTTQRGSNGVSFKANSTPTTTSVRVEQRYGSSSTQDGGLNDVTYNTVIVIGGQ